MVYLKPPENGKEAALGVDELADTLLKMAARRSIETPFGWTHPDCVALQEAARLLKGEPEPKPPRFVGAVLSS